MYVNLDQEYDNNIVPELLGQISKFGLLQMEKNDPASLAFLFKNYGIPDLLINKSHGGRGYSLADAISVVREVACHCPSLSIMMVMHHHTIYCFNHYSGSPFSSILLEKVCIDHALVSSAFSEFKHGCDILDSSVQCISLGDMYQINGEKKPCTMANVSDVIVAGASVVTKECVEGRGFVLIDRGLVGVASEKFWPCDFLSGTDSNKVLFQNVIVSDDYVITPGIGVGNETGTVANMESTLSCVFQLLVSSSYIGMLLALVRIVINKALESERVDYISSIESCCMMLDHLALSIDHNDVSIDTLASTSMVTHQIRRIVTECLNSISQNIGGVDYLDKQEVRYLMQVIRCINFHPPSFNDRNKIINSIFSL